MKVTYQKYKNIILELMCISLIIVTCKLSTTSCTKVKTLLHMVHLLIMLITIIIINFNKNVFHFPTYIGIKIR